MFLAKTGQFERLLDKATSHLLLEPDWSANVAICDLIRQNDITPKVAFTSIKKRLGGENPHSILFTLQLIETLTKNCGSPVHEAIGTGDFMETMKKLSENNSEAVRIKSLELIQSWAKTFGKNNREIKDAYEELLNEGAQFPEFRESDAMFSSESAPEWQEGDICHRCKTAFSTFRRRHHCRNCGNSVCDKCCTKRSVLPRYGIEKEVRVCDPCYNILSSGNKPTAASVSSSGEKPDKKVRIRTKNSETPASVGSQQREEEEKRKREKALELQEKEELELALALSASEAESKEKQRMRQLGYNAQAPTPSNQLSRGVPFSNTQAVGGSTVQQQPQQQQPSQVYAQLDTSDLDPELARYLNRHYWEGRSAISDNFTMPQPGAPPYSSSSSVVGVPQSNASVLTSASMVETPSAVDETNSVLESASNALTQQQKTEFLAALRGSIDIFINRMRSNSLRNRSISMDNTVQTLFLTLNAMHPQLLQYVNGLEEQRTYHETLQDKLSQLREAREALNALRQDNMECRRQEELEAARQRQYIMQQKLYLMRQQKETYLQAQREMTLQRLQEQQREMALRQEAQKQMQNQMTANLWAQPQLHYGQNMNVPGGPMYYPHQPIQTTGSDMNVTAPAVVNNVPNTYQSVATGNPYLGPGVSNVNYTIPMGGHYNMDPNAMNYTSPAYGNTYSQMPPSTNLFTGGGSHHPMPPATPDHHSYPPTQQQTVTNEPKVEEAALISFD